MNAKELKEKVSQVLALEARERSKKLKQIGFEAINYFKSLKDPTAEDLKDLMEVLKTVIKAPSNSTRFTVALSMITAKYLALIGCSQVQVILKESTKISIDGGVFAVGDQFYATERSDEFLNVDAINRGDRYIFGTQGDGDYNIQVRMVEAPEPVLTSEEYERAGGASSVVILNFPTGKLYVDWAPVMEGIKPPIELDIAPGHYKCQVFVFESSEEDYSYYIVLSKTEDRSRNNEKEVIDLRPY